MNIRLLYLGWLPTLFFFGFIYVMLMKLGYTLEPKTYFAFSMAYIGGVIGNILLTYVDSEVYYVEGFLDALWKKFFWKFGPQIVGILLGFWLGYSLFVAGFDFTKLIDVMFSRF